jgi:(1->4)-alpha-D-glucan 1-alpha-D-glucosylmutase
MRKPLATYRLQLHSGFGFDAAAEIADYLEALGVSHIYCSPYLQAMPGSTHGYDVADHHRVNIELGGEEAHERFSLRMGSCHLGQVLDIVPNHMAIGNRWNTWWWDVLENGLASPYASYFDIDWQAPEERLRNKVLLPILGDHYGRVLKRFEIKLVRSGAEFTARYFDHELPIAPESIAPILASAATRVTGDVAGAESLAFFADSLMRLPVYGEADRAGLIARNRDQEVIRRWLERLLSEKAGIAAAVDAALASVNESVDVLDSVLDRQNYRLAYWKAASRDLGYRRFFDINTLVGLHMEDEQVFNDTHSLILKWLEAGVLDGVRVDHPDGLRDPREYFRRLREAAPDVWIVAEKILEPGEKLPEDWPVEGTTGYDYLNMVGGILIDPAGERPLTAFYERFTGRYTAWEEVTLEKKAQGLRDLLGSDVNRLAAIFQEICERNRDHRDYTRHEVRHAIRALVASFPVYRTYVRAAAGQVGETDIACVDAATEKAKKTRPDLDCELFDFLREVLLLRTRGAVETEFTMQFQQFTGPAMAKGVEDTAFYTYNRLLALNEVGGDPGRFGVSVADFHAYCEERHRHWPRTQLAGSTHDTKRSDDVRARIAVLSEIPDEWGAAVLRWASHNERYKREGAPDRNTEYHLYQTMLGAWPISAERLHAYMQKACREAREQTRWTEPNEAFETTVKDFVSSILADAEFLQDFQAFVAKTILPGRINSLSQTLLRLVSPGVPDIYQGTEIWDLSLVDPDNRRPVDYTERRKLLAEMHGLKPEEIVARMESGMPKLWTVHQAFKVRREHPAAFGPDAAYTPVSASGSEAHRIVSFLRAEDVMAIAPRLTATLNGWGDTAIEIPAGAWRNRLTGDAVSGGAARIEDLLVRFPVALLTRETGTSQPNPSS